MSRFLSSGIGLETFAILAEGKGMGCLQSKHRNAHRASARLSAASRGAMIEALEGRELLSSYYVSTSGSDSNAGTLAAPFRTIQKAANVVKAGDTAYIRGGTYREQVTVPTSGSSSAPITFKAYNNEKVIVSGADVISNWSLNSGKTYKATQSWDLGTGKNQIFVDGKMMNWARWPNTSLDISNPVKASADSSANGGSQSGTIYDNALTKPSDYVGAIIQVLPGERWVAQTGTVTSAATGKINYTLLQGMNSSGENVRAGTPYYLVGKFQFLDTAGEWFRDPSGALYLWTPNSDSPSSHVVEAKHRQYSFDLSNRDYITIDGISTFAAGINSNNSSSHIVISKLDAKYVSQFTTIGNGLHEGNRDTGIILRGTANTLKDSHIQYSAGNGVTIIGSSTTVTNSVISDFAYAATDSVGVWSEGADNKITWNTIYDGGRSLIRHDGSPRLQILHNDLSKGGLQTGDVGATHTYNQDGGGTVIAYNVIHDMHTGGATGATGLYLDKGSRNYIIHHNLVYDTDRAMTLTTPQSNNKIYNNTLVGDNYSLGNYYLQSMSGVVFKNNIFTSDVRISSNATTANNIYEGTDPQFVNPGAGNYTLKSTSPAVNKGTSISGYTDGSNGTPDIGAFEYGQTPWKAGANQGGSTTPPPDPDPTPPPTSSNSVVGKTLQAEAFNWSTGPFASGGILKGNDGNEYVKYNSLNFGSGVTKLTLRYAVPASNAGQTIEIRTDTWDGKVVGTYKPTSTGSWNTFAEVTINLTKISGVHNLYFAFKGTYGVVNLDWFKFS